MNDQNEKAAPYTVTFKGPRVCSTVKVESPEDLEIVDLLMERVRKSVATPEQQEGS